MNRKLGQTGALVSGAGVLVFGLSLLAGFWADLMFVSCLSSMFIAIGHVTWLAALAGANQDAQRSGVSVAAVAFGTVYAVLVLLVYYAMCTTVRMNPTLSEEALTLISYGQTGSLFFNYDLLGYGFMGLSTFFAGFVVRPVNMRAKALRWLLWAHGVFFPLCFVMPMLPVFTAENAGASQAGVFMLIGWCLYFLPVCLLAADYFRAPDVA